MQNRTILVLGLILAVVLGSLVAAFLTGGEDILPKENVAQEGEKRLETSISEEGAYHRITAILPKETGLKNGADATALSLMDGFVRAAIADFKIQSGLESLTEEDIAMLGLGGERRFTMDIAHETYTSPKTISFVFTIYEDTMGAHPNASYRTFTFDTETGEELLLSDLFFSANYLDFLSENSRAHIKERLGGDVNSEYLEGGTTPDAPNFQHFYLTDTELVIIFPPYQVGPWAIGTQLARFPKETLADHLLPQYR
jgi:hypothetical protein